MSEMGAKLKYRIALRVDNIPDYRIKDFAFWTQYFTLWLNPDSELNRLEVVYEVLLPWLSELKILPDSKTATRSFA